MPVLVHDGAVHIESNDILKYLESTFPKPALIPAELKEQIEQGLKEEDDLHLDIRAITMGFLSPKSVVMKKSELLDNYQNNQGTLQGEQDEHKALEIKFWREFADAGITENQALRAARNFYDVYSRYEQALENQSYLLGDEITLLDIAWYIYTFRIHAAGYPFQDLHPRVFAWFQNLNNRPEFTHEVSQPWPMTVAIKVLQVIQKLRGQSLAQVMKRGGLYKN